MFEFEKQYKDAVQQAETIAAQVKKAHDFWFDAILSSFKSFVKTK